MTNKTKKNMTIMASLPYESSSIMSNIASGIEPYMSTFSKETEEERELNINRLKLKEQLEEKLASKEIELNKQKL